jgi:hypothetical protein
MIIKRWRSSTTTVTFTLTSGQTGITGGSVTNLINSMAISGTGVPPGTTIEFITGASTLTMSQPATQSGSFSLTFEGGFEEMWPKTVANKLFNNSGTDSLFDSNQQLKSIYLPSYVLGSMKLVGSLSIPGSPSSPLDLKTLITGTVTSGYAVSTNLDTFTGVTHGVSSPGGYRPGNEPQKGANYIGHYWVCSVGMGLMDSVSSSGAADWAAAIFDDGVTTTTSAFNNVLSLEAGDWLVITGFNSTNETFIFSVINNTYSAASTLSDGVARLSSSNNVGAYNVSTNAGGLTNGGTKVITEDNLFDMMGTGATNIAYGSHTHGNISAAGVINTNTAPADGQHLVITSSADAVQQSSVTFGASTTIFLTNAGTWATPAGTYAHPTQTAINANATDNGINVIDSVTVNTLGHVTAVGTRDLSAATISAAGVMSAADKTKLDGIATSANAYVHPNHTGDVTSTGDGATVIANNVVTNAKLAQITTATIKGRATAGSGNVEDLSASQVRTIINVADGANNYTHPTYTYSTPTDSTETTLTNIQLISTLTQTNGHVTGGTARKLVAGSNVTITPASNGNITIASTNTTYTAQTGGGLSLTGTAFGMVHPFYAQNDAPTTPLVGTIWFDL